MARFLPVLGALLALAMLLLGGLRRKAAGPVLLDLGRSGRQWAVFLLGLLLLVWAVALVVGLHAVSGFFLALVGLYFLFVGWSGRQIRDRGIWTNGWLVRWGELADWSLANGTLRARPRWRSRWILYSITLPLPAAEVKRIAEELHHRLPSVRDA